MPSLQTVPVGAEPIAIALTVDGNLDVQVVPRGDSLTLVNSAALPHNGPPLRNRETVWVGELFSRARPEVTAVPMRLLIPEALAPKVQFFGMISGSRLRLLGQPHARLAMADFTTQDATVFGEGLDFTGGDIQFTGARDASGSAPDTRVVLRDVAVTASQHIQLHNNARLTMTMSAESTALLSVLVGASQPSPQVYGPSSMQYQLHRGGSDIAGRSVLLGAPMDRPFLFER